MCPVSVQYTAFGEMAVSVDGVRYPLTRRRERGVLSVLLVAHGSPGRRRTSRRRGVGRGVAAGRRSPRCRWSSRGCAGLLEPDRAARKGTRLVSTAAGYSLQAEVVDVDTWSFEAERGCGPGRRGTGRPPRARATGPGRCGPAPPYADADARPSAGGRPSRRAALTLAEEQARALLDLGRPDEALRSLADLAGTPSLPRATVVAAGAGAVPVLAAGRRPRDAAHAARAALADELGVDPLPRDPAARGGHAAAGPARWTAPFRRPVASMSRDRYAGGEPAEPGTDGVGRSVGRDVVHEQLVQAHREHDGSREPAFVLVAGEAGIGKSRAGRRPDRPPWTLEGTRVPSSVTASRASTHRPFWPWLGRASAAWPRADALARSTRSSSRCWPASPPRGRCGPGAPLRMFDAVVDLLVTGGRPSVRCWSCWRTCTGPTPSSLLLLRHLARRRRAARSRCSCTRRTTGDPTSEALVDTMATLARAGAERVRLDGLGRRLRARPPRPLRRSHTTPGSTTFVAET